MDTTQYATTRTVRQDSFVNPVEVLFHCACPCKLEMMEHFFHVFWQLSCSNQFHGNICSDNGDWFIMVEFLAKRYREGWGIGSGCHWVCISQLWAIRSHDLQIHYHPRPGSRPGGFPLLGSVDISLLRGLLNPHILFSIAYCRNHWVFVVLVKLEFTHDLSRSFVSIESIVLLLEGANFADSITLIPFLVGEISSILCSIKHINDSSMFPCELYHTKTHCSSSFW